MNLLEVLAIDSELECQKAAKGKDSDNRKRIRAEFIARQMEGLNRFYLRPFDLDLVGEIRSKREVWFLTGPFMTSRGRDEEVKAYRFCEKGREHPEHLLAECKKLQQLGLNKENFSIEEFGRTVRRITVLSL